MEKAMRGWWEAMAPSQRFELTKVLRNSADRVDVRQYFVDNFGLNSSQYAWLSRHSQAMFSFLSSLGKLLILRILGFLGFPYPARLAATNKQLNSYIRGSAVDLFDSTLAAHEMRRYFPSDYWQITGVSLHFAGTRADFNEFRLPSLQHLRRLRVQGLVQDVTFLPRCPQVALLELPSAHWIKDLSPIQACNSLVYLSMTNCHALSSLAPLSHCQLLESVRLMDASVLQDLSPLVSLRALHTVILSNLPPGASLHTLQFCNLHTLSLSLTWLESIKSLGLCNVRIFAVQSPVLNEVSQLINWPHLERVTFSYCPALADVSSLVHCPLLELVKLQASLPLKTARQQLCAPGVAAVADPATDSVRLERRAVLGKRSARVEAE